MAEIKEYFPHILRDVYEFQALSDAESPYVKEAWENSDKILSEAFIESAGDYGLGRLEKLLGLITMDTYTDEERRFRILSRYNETPPITKYALMNLLDVLCGKGRYELIIEIEAYSLHLKLALTSKHSLTLAKEMLDRLVPVNMTIEASLMYNTWRKAGALTWKEANGYTWKELREEVLRNE